MGVIETGRDVGHPGSGGLREPIGNCRASVHSSSSNRSLGGAALEAPEVERRLAAILVADVVGYSRLVERDEVDALAALKGVRQRVLEPLIAAYRGRLVDAVGDGVLIEFGSVVDAVSCAVEL